MAAASLTLTARGQTEEEKTDTTEGRHRVQPVYLNGCGWDRTLPGVFGQACFAFEMRSEIGGTGLGTIRDDVHTEVNSQIQITESVQVSGREYLFRGAIISSRSSELIGMNITISARSTGNGTGEASLIIESQDNGLVVIAIIMPLIALLLPARQ